MPTAILARAAVLPELKLIEVQAASRGVLSVKAVTRSTREVCPKCAEPSSSIYDRRTVTIRDEPWRRRDVNLVITKRRFMCKPCGRPFTEPVAGIRKGARTTERYRKAVFWACETFTDLKAVRTHYRCSGGYIYDNLYPLLERKRRERATPWPKTIGIDEHSFKRDNKNGYMRFATMVVTYNRKRVMEVVEGKSGAELREALAEIPGRENVQHVTLDMSDAYKSFAKDFFPNAKLVADKFHVLRLITPAINKRRMEYTGKRTPRLRRLLLTNGYKLNYIDRLWLKRWLDQAPILKELYVAKEALHRFYRTKGRDRAARALTRLTDELARSKLPELKTLRKTLMKWRDEILEYFSTGLTNARTEGFNNVAKLVKKRAYGYRRFENYRLAVLNACA